MSTLPVCLYERALTFCQAVHLAGGGSIQEKMSSLSYRGRVQDLAMWSCLLLGRDFRKFFVRDGTGSVLLRGSSGVECYSAAEFCRRGRAHYQGVGFRALAV